MTKARTNADNYAADITGVTAGTGITGGGTSGTVTVTNSLLTTIDAAGDLLYGTGSDAATRLGIGTAGQVLAVNTGATAPEWATLATPSVSANWTLLNTGGTTLTTGTTTISGISGKDKIMVLFDGASTGTSGSAIRFRVNGNTGAVYTANVNQITGVSSYAASNITDSPEPSTTSLVLASMAANAATSVSGGITLTGCNSSGLKQFWFNASGRAGASSNHTSRVGQGFIDDSNPITSISMFTTDTFDAGTVYVYGSDN